MTRVLLLLTAPAWRGSGVSFAKIAKGLTRGSDAVTVVVAHEEVAQGLRDAGLTDIIRLDLIDSGLQSTRLLSRQQQERRWEVAIVDSPRDVRLAAGAGITPIVWRFNLPNRAVPDDLWSRWRFRGVRRIVAQSEFAASLARTNAPRLAKRGTVIVPNGYDIEDFPQDSARARAWRTARGISLDAPLLVTVSALSPEKALPETIAVGSLLADRIPGVTQVIVGSGELSASLHATAPAHLRLLGQCGAAETLDAMRAADLVLQLSSREIFPNVIAEAMALGCTVVGATSGAAPEVLGESGILRDATATESIAAIAMELLADPERRTSLGQQARVRVDREFPIARMESGYHTVVRDLMHSRHHRSGR